MISNKELTKGLKKYKNDLILYNDDINNFVNSLNQICDTSYIFENRKKGQNI